MIIRSDKWNEEYYYEKLPNGLEVYLMNKPEYLRTYASIAVNFGSVDTMFIPPFKEKYVNVPIGTAHFLEHEMFDGKDDISLRFAELGSECNAFTTFDRTVYSFSTLNNLNLCLELLLELVQTKKYTEDSINNERQNINQEIKMYENMPSNVHYRESLCSMYHYNQIRNEITGTIDSVEKVNKEVLDICYDAFYHPSNMCLVVVGNFDLQEVLNLIKNDQSKRKFRDFTIIKRKYPEEPIDIKQKKLISDYKLLIPKISINLKIPAVNNDSMTNLKNDLALSILTDFNFDETSEFYEYLIENDIINNTYGYESFVDDGFSYIMFYCDTHKYDEFEKFICHKLNNMNLLQEEDLTRYKKTIFAANIRKMNNLDYYVTMLIDACFCNLTLFEIFDTVDSIKLEDVNKMIECFKENMITTVIFKDEEHQ